MKQKGTLLGIKHNEDGSLDFIAKGEDGKTYTAKGCRLHIEEQVDNDEDVATMLAHKQSDPIKRLALESIFMESRWHAS